MKKILIVLLFLLSSFHADDFLDKYQIFGPIYEKGFDKMNMAENHLKNNEKKEAMLLFEEAILLLKEAKEYRVEEQVNKIRALRQIADDRINKASNILYKYYLHNNQIDKARLYKKKLDK